MDHATRVALVSGLLVLNCSAVFGQTTPATPPQLSSFTTPSTFTCRITMGPLLGSMVAGPTAPYSAVREFTNIQTLADGTHISHKPTSEKISRDSQNRIRTEQPICPEAADDPNGMAVIIRDPVSGYAYLLDAQNRVAHRYPMQVRQQGQPPVPYSTKALMDSAKTIVPPRTQSSKRTSTTEPLGSQTMEGLVVEGTKTTTVIPVGEEDNDGPITVVTEQWYSRDLKITVLTKASDPRHGDTTTRLTNIDRAEPSLTLFEPPPDYKIVDDSESVKLDYTRP